MHKFYSANFRKYFISLVAILLLIALSGCPVIDLGTPNNIPQPTVTSSDEVIRSALSAYGDKNYTQAVNLSASALQRDDIAPTQRILLFRINALSLTELEPGKRSLSALDQWRRQDANVTGMLTDSTTEWITAWKTSIDKLPESDRSKEINKVLNDISRPWQLRSEAAIYSAGLQLAQGGPKPFAIELANSYNENTISSDRASLEKRLFSFMHRLDEPTLNGLVALVDEYNEKVYPYAIFKLEQARRLNMNTATRENALEILGYLQEDSQLTDQLIFNRWMDTEVAAVAGVNVVSTDIALVLPLNSQVTSISNKILSGARIAGNAISAQGKQIRLHIIDSDKPNWINDLANIPAEVMVVGGPLRATDYAQIRDAGLLSNKAFFAFIPRFKEPDEGIMAWRFFPSDQDQARAVVKFALSIGVNSFGALAPSGDYGNRMVQAFAATVQEEGGHLVKTGQYPARQYKEWSKTIGGFLNSTKRAARAPSTTYQAIYLPDTWKETTLLLPYFHYYRETRLLLMGNSLWEQGIRSDQAIDYNMFRNSIFTEAWNPSANTSAGQLLKASASSSGEADLWYSLGYDFVNLATTLNIRPGAGPNEVNFALTQINTDRWSGAPIKWDINGIARQDLYVLTITEDGIKPADPLVFQERMRKLWGY